MLTYDARLDRLCIDTIRFLAVDAVEQAQSGHPGAPMGMAPMAYTLWQRFLMHNPRNPQWPNRDRFILSAGHASMLLYSLLYLTGYGLTIDDLQRFRQWGSRTPGHPEYGCTPGVEVTTGPLGQGFANGVGMAIAARYLAARYNRPDFPVIDHVIYTLASDGDMQEGVASEAASLAGTLQLGNVICLYDDNEISIEGSTDLSFRENVGARFQAYGWQVIGPIDGMDTLQVDVALRQAKIDSSRPSLIVCRTIIGYGSPEQATGKVHGEPLGAAGVAATKHNLHWPAAPEFHVPDEVLTHMRAAIERGEETEDKWRRMMDAYAIDYPDLAREYWSLCHAELPQGWHAPLPNLFAAGGKPIATRSASGQVINALAPHLSGLLGGSADLAPSTKTEMTDEGSFSAGHYAGRNLHFGVREHAMGAIANGMARYDGLIPYTATFLIFSDYMRPAIRLAALSGLQVIFLFTHDSIALGEDGPTHQPIEQLMSLRLIPNLTLIRPCDAAETAYAWQAAIEHRDGPTAIALSRQNLPMLDRTRYAPATGVLQGGYLLWQSSAETAEILLIATGSEVAITLQAAEALAEEGTRVRVISLPSWEIFARQSAEYREQVLPDAVRKRIAIEAGASDGWQRYVGAEGRIIGIDHFGASAPGTEVYSQFGFTVAQILQVAHQLLLDSGNA